MTTDQIILFGLFAGLFAMLIWGRYRYDLVAFSALLLGVVLGAVPYESAFTGFGHPATVIVALVLVVSAGLVNAGAVQMITRKVVDGGRSLGGHIALLGGVGAVLSGFINNVAALALLMPVDIHAARKAKRAPGLSLMPLSFATILGGMVTLIGTPPNIIIASIREEELGQSFAMFDFAPVGAVAALAGMAFITLVGWRLIPDRAATSDPADALQEASAYLAELSVPEDSDAVGKRLADLDETANSADVTVLGLIRDGTRRYGSSRGTKLKSEDVLVLEAQPEALDDFRAALGLTYTDADGRERIEDESDGLALTEAVVPARCAHRRYLGAGGWAALAATLGHRRRLAPGPPHHQEPEPRKDHGGRHPAAAHACRFRAAGDPLARLPAAGRTRPVHHPAEKGLAGGRPLRPCRRRRHPTADPAGDRPWHGGGRLRSDRDRPGARPL